MSVRCLLPTRRYLFNPLLHTYEVQSLQEKQLSRFTIGRSSFSEIPKIYLVSDQAGMDHLLPGKQAPSETRTACYMGLLSQLAAKPEVLRVSPFQSATLHNAVANALVQSATTTQTPLLDAGLDGTGEVIQVSA